MTLLRKLAGETAIYGISSILSRLLNYVILTPYFTRVFLTEEYGNISILYTYAAILMVLFTYRMETAFFRFGSKEGEMDRAFSTASFSLLGTTTFFCLLVGWFVQPIAGLLNYGDHPEYILLVGGLIALDALAAIPFARLRLENRPIRFMVAKTGQILLNIFFVYLFLETLPNLDPQSWLGQWYDPESRISWVFVANLLASGLILLLLLPVYL
ncbi:MAG: polysaccharide biosynthesis protein, partial [Saprospiraceae bacterium]|nr:polysaccharide biosynthesis protein [Saprospiraceae bacterium]